MLYSEFKNEIAFPPSTAAEIQSSLAPSGIVYVFLSYCGHCIREIPKINEMYAAYTKDNSKLKPYWISLDQHGSELEKLASSGWIDEVPDSAPQHYVLTKGKKGLTLM